MNHTKRFKNFAIGVTFVLGAGISFMCAEQTKASKIFMTHPADSSVSLIDLNTMKEIRKIHVGPNPYFPAVSGDGKTLAVTVEDEKKIKYYSTDNFELIGELEFGAMDADHLMLLPDGKHAILADNVGDAAVILDLETHQITKRIEGISSPHNIQIGRSGNYVYMTSKKNPGISKIDIKEQKLVKFMPTDVIPRGLMISPDETTLYYGARWISGIFAMNIESGDVRLMQIPLPHGKTEMASSTYHSLWTVNDSILFGVNEGFSSADIINVRTGELIDRFEDVDHPSTVEPVPGDPNTYVVTCFGDNAVKLFHLDPETYKLSLERSEIIGTANKARPKRYCYWKG